MTGTEIYLEVLCTLCIAAIVIPIITKRRSIKRKLQIDSEKDFDKRINKEIRNDKNLY